MKLIFWSYVCFSSAFAFAGERVRRVEVKTDQIVTVRTAIGVATIIQVPDRPNSIVVGDQAGFKVEYLDQAVTIKPLHGGARSNLYIYTDYRRFNVQLVTAAEPSADYVVYLENPKEKIKSSPLSWGEFRKQLKNESITLATRRLAKTRDGVLLIEFEVRSERRELFKPECIWLTQKGDTFPIHSLAVSAQELGEGRVVKGILQILRGDIDENEPLRIEMRRKKTSYLSLPKVISWK